MREKWLNVCINNIPTSVCKYNNFTLRKNKNKFKNIPKQSKALSKML